MERETLGWGQVMVIRGTRATWMIVGPCGPLGGGGEYVGLRKGLPQEKRKNKAGLEGLDCV